MRISHEVLPDPVFALWKKSVANASLLADAVSPVPAVTPVFQVVGEKKSQGS